VPDIAHPQANDRPNIVLGNGLESPQGKHSLHRRDRIQTHVESVDFLVVALPDAPAAAHIVPYTVLRAWNGRARIEPNIVLDDLKEQLPAKVLLEPAIRPERIKTIASSFQKDQKI